MFPNKNCDRASIEETQIEPMFTYSRVLDEIAEVTRNNNIMNAETTSFSNCLASNANNHKLYQMSKHISNNQIADQNISVAIKNENDKFSENSDDDENLFNCQVELIEEPDYQNTEIKFLGDETESNLSEPPDYSNETPKIHLKTVDEINRKCIVSNYMDIVKKRRQEVNRRYYLKRKQQMGKHNVKNKSQQENECVKVNQVPLNENEIQSKNIVQIMEPGIQQPIKTEPVVEANPTPPVQLENFSCMLNERFSEDFVPNFPMIEIHEEGLSDNQMLDVCNKYMRDTKRMRKEINRRYYLKRKKKLQLEKGTTDRVIIKNEAYMRRRERNRRYYLKRKEKLRKNDQEVDSSSNSQSSLQMMDYNSSLSNIIPHDEQMAEMNANLDSETMEENKNSLEYSCLDDQKQEIKHENVTDTDVDTDFSQNYMGLVQNLFCDQATERWIEDQGRFSEMNVVKESIYNCDYKAMPTYSNSNLDMYLEEAARKRQERNRRYYLKHKEKLKQQRLDKCRKEK